MFGMHGKIIRVNLPESKVSVEEFSEDEERKFFGGPGLATKYLFEEVKKGIDPLGPENKLIWMTGLLTGTTSPSTGRYSIVAKSPLTGIWGQSNSAGYWGSTFKRTGFDGIIFEGVSEKPVYLYVKDDEAELRDASHLWGKNTAETTALIQEEVGDQRANVACIGIAGENQVKYAAIINDLHRAAGRCGMGAVAGSKRLKAVVANGRKHPTTMANPAAFREVSKKQYELINQGILKIALEAF